MFVQFGSFVYLRLTPDLLNGQLAVVSFMIGQVDSKLLEFAGNNWPTFTRFVANMQHL